MTQARYIDGLPAAEYHSFPALSAGGAQTLLEQTPAHYWLTSPFNPKAERSPESKEFDIGTAVHLAILEPDELDARTRIVQAENYKTKAAQEARDAARAEGAVPLLPHQRDQVLAMRGALLADEDAAPLLASGVSERSGLWTDPATGVPCKLRVDKMPLDGSAMIDVKTTTNAKPEWMSRQMMTLGWPLRAVWYLEGWRQITGTMPRDYFFVCVEKDPPHVVQVMRLPDRAIEWGAKFCDAARARFATCLAEKRWPAKYRTGPITLEMPGWAEFQLEERRMDGEFDVAVDRVLAGVNPFQ